MDKSIVEGVEATSSELMKGTTEARDEILQVLAELKETDMSAK